MIENLQRPIVVTSGLNGAVEHPQPVSSYEQAMDMVLHRVDFKQQVVLEGAPGYLRHNPQEAYASQNPTHPSFVGSWKFALDLRERLVSSGKVRDAILMDDFNNMLPEERENRNQYLQEFVNACSFLGDYPLSKPDHDDENVLWRWESNYVDLENPELNKCSKLDAKFQGEKVVFQKGNHHLIDWTEETLLVMVHPLEFQTQQRMMLDELARSLKQQYFADGVYPPRLERQVLDAYTAKAFADKKDKFDPEKFKNSVVRTLISNLYCHVWVDSDGEVAGVTHPRWDKDAKGFIHEELL